MIKICNNCGYKGETNFCPNCGAKMSEFVSHEPEEMPTDLISQDNGDFENEGSTHEDSSENKPPEIMTKQSTNPREDFRAQHVSSKQQADNSSVATYTTSPPPQKKKGKKALKIAGIVLGVLVLAFIVLLFIPIDEEKSDSSSFPDSPINTELSGLFDKDTAKSFKVNGLKCYVPKEWDLVENFSTNEGENLDEVKAVYINPKETNGITYPVYYYVKVSDHEGLSFNGWLNIIKDNLDGAYNIENTTIPGCNNAATFEILEPAKKSRGYAIECGDSHIIILMICCDPAFYDINEFDTIVESAEYAAYSKKHPYKEKVEETKETTKVTTKATTEPTEETTKATTKAKSSGGGLGTEVTDFDTKADVWACAQDVVMQDLKSPATADFCSYTDATVYHQSGNQYIAMGYVDSENGFGANIRTRFTVWLTMTETGYKDAHAEYD